MDPNATLDHIRSLLVQFDKATNPDAAGDIAMDIAESVRNLDKWISKGGFLPRAWQPKTEVVDAELESK